MSEVKLKKTALLDLNSLTKMSYFYQSTGKNLLFQYNQLLRTYSISPIPATATSSQKAHFDNISGTKRGSIDPLVSKRQEKNSE